MQPNVPRRMILAAGLVSPAIARAQGSWPDRPIKLIIPWPPGASADVFLRSIADQAGKRLGQTVLPENRPGANGSLGGVVLKDARPDGYTLAQIHTGVFRAAMTAERPVYDGLTDFTYIAQLSGSVHGIVVRADSPWQNFESFVAAAKADPGKLNYGTFGPASIQNLVMVDIQQRLGISWRRGAVCRAAEQADRCCGGCQWLGAIGGGWAVPAFGGLGIEPYAALP